MQYIARIRVQLPTSCPEGALFRAVALGLMPSRPRAAEPRGRGPRRAAYKGRSISNALHGELRYTDPDKRIVGACRLNRAANNAPRHA